MANGKRNTMDIRIREAVHSVEPEANLILYGSRARGTASPESDWDLLILVDGEISNDRVDRIRSQLYEVEWDTGEVITSVIRTKAEWHSKTWRAMPFHQRVETEGIAL